MRTALALTTLITLTACGSTEPDAAPTVTVTEQAAAGGLSADCEYALDQADKMIEADGALASSLQDALDASEDAIHALANDDPDAFDKAFAANEKAKKDVDLNDRKSIQQADSYKQAAKKCRGE